MKRWEVDKLYDDTGLVAIITATEKETSRGVYVNFSVGFFREFERSPDSAVEKTAFVHDYQLESIRGLIDRVQERLQIEKDKHHAERRAKRNQRVVGSRDAIP